ncbi:MAG: hypothetical protein JXR52_10710 [Bacteroidales bacterium]|nr:hypothetical protein [Bacteroidales bacterium]
MIEEWILNYKAFFIRMGLSEKWDESISTIPPCALVSESFSNWIGI